MLVNEEPDLIVEMEFEETRRCLLNSYHSYTQTHSGYVIAAVVGLIAVIYSSGTLLQSGVGGVIAFFILLFGGTLLLMFMSLRIVYWSIYASCALVLSIDDVINNFNYYNFCSPFPYQSKPPNTAVLQSAIVREIEKTKENDSLPWFKCLALWTAKPNNDIFRTLLRKAKRCLRYSITL